MEISKKYIEDVCFITIKNNSGMEVVLSSFGASFYDIKTVDKNGMLESIVLTPNNLEDFYFSDGYYGKIVGRFSGRIDDSKCVIDNTTYHLDRNWNGINALHGGFEGISFKNFDYEITEKNTSVEVVFTYLEKEKDLPGDVSYKFIYQIEKDKNEINLGLEATTTKDTLVNLTNHVYFNLSGNGVRDCKEQKLQLLCDKYTRLNNELITLSIDPVNEVMDFTSMHEIGKYIYDESLQNHIAKGYDHCFIKAEPNNPLVAIMKDDISGRRVSVYTSYPAIVCYGGCYPKDFAFNKEGFKIGQYHSMCLECQYVPNGINMDDVEKGILKTGEEYKHYIKYVFDIE